MHFLPTKFKSFDVANGLSGLQRNIIVKLCRLMWHKEQQVRVIFGMCAEYFEWRQQHDFIMGRPFKIAVSFLPSSSAGLTKSFPRSTHIMMKDRTVFISLALTKGIYRWNFTIAYDQGNNTLFHLCIGAAPPHLVGRCADAALGYLRGTVSLSIWKNVADVCYANLCGAKVPPDTAPVGMQPLNGSLLSVEADCGTRTLSFFVDNIKDSRAISSVFVPLFVGITGSTSGKLSFTSLSFRRLPSATPSSTVCKAYPYEIRPSLFDFF